MKFFYKLLYTVLLLITLSIPAAATKKSSECVILLHGLARSEKSLTKLETHLKKQGYYVVNIGYPSRKKNIQTLSVETLNKALEKCSKVKADKIHFVTHSMGGILVRYYLDHNSLKNLGRVVMLSPPNQGSEVVDKLKDLKVFKWFNGPAGQQLDTDRNSLPNKIGPPYYEAGVITGDKTINPILSLMIPGDDDGKVSVEKAKLKGMKDFMVVHKSHALIMNDENVLKQVSFFIKNGVFDRTPKKKSK